MEKLDQVKMNENEDKPESLSLSEGTAEGTHANSNGSGEKSAANQPVDQNATAGSGNPSGKEPAGPNAPLPPHQKPIIRIGGRLVQDGH